MANVAKFIKAANSDWRGDARIYELTPPFEFGKGEDTKTVTYVVVSATTTAQDGDETFIFPITEPAKPVPEDWNELPGSTRGILDHAEALKALGYEIA